MLRILAMAQESVTSKAIAAELHMSQRQAQRYLKELAEDGYLDRQCSTQNRLVTYTVTSKAKLKLAVELRDAQTKFVEACCQVFRAKSEVDKRYFSRMFVESQLEKNKSDSNFDKWRLATFILFQQQDEIDALKAQLEAWEGQT